MTYFYLYLLSQDFTSALIPLSIFLMIGLIVWTIVIGLHNAEDNSHYQYEKEKDGKNQWSYPKKYLYFLVGFFLLIAMLFPNKQTLTYWGAFYVGKEVVQSEPVQKLYNILNEKLDKELQELTEIKLPTK